jgi:hypothetical protein
VDPTQADLVPSEQPWDFLRCAQLHLKLVMPPMPEDRFWDLVEGLGWGARATVAGAGARLAKKLRLVDCVAAANRAQELGSRLRERLEEWERDSGQSLPLSDDAFMALVHHVVGLGQSEYLRLMREPTLAQRRTRLRTFRDSFLQIFQAAQQGYPLEDWAEALEAAGTPIPHDQAEARIDGALVDHPAHGLGLVRHPPGGAQIRWVFAEGDLLLPPGA